MEAENKELHDQVHRFQQVLENVNKRNQILKQSHCEMNNQYAQLQNENRIIRDELECIKSAKITQDFYKSASIRSSRPSMLEKSIHPPPTTPRIDFLKTPRHSITEFSTTIPKLTLQYSSGMRSEDDLQSVKCFEIYPGSEAER